jgi:sodium transport system permease protein
VKPLAIVTRKEIVDNLRDRRALATALVMPLLGPLAMVAVFFAMKDAEQKMRAPEVPVIGAEHAPELVGWLRRQGVTILPPPASPEDEVRSDRADLALRIPPGFAADLRQGTPALVEIVCDPSRQRSVPTLARIERLLEGYGAQIGAMRLQLRGVDPSIMSAVRVERVDVGAPDAKKALLLASLPLFLLMACFLGGTYVAIDVTAGERERGSLESLLMNPVQPSVFVLSKTVATFVFGLLSMVVSLAAFSVILRAVPFDEIGLDIQLAPKAGAAFLLLFLPTTLTAAAIQLLVGTVSKNTKTAQASLGFIILAPVVPAVIVTLFPQQPHFANVIVPFLGEAILSLRILRGEPVELLHWLANAGANATAAAVLVGLTARLFGPRMLSG